MLHRADAMHNFALLSKDESIGKVKDFYFDDRFFTVRYLLADTGNWLTGRLVLISPYAVTSIDEEAQTISTSLTRKQIEDSPSPDVDMPVSRQFETAYHDYYGWPYYWYGPYAWGGYLQPLPPPEKVEREEKSSWDGHLRGVKEVRGYRVEASDDDVGHVSDFIIDGSDWTIRYLVIDTRNWWPGKHVLLSPKWVEEVDWFGRTVSVDMTRDAIKEAPEYDEEAPITREYETLLHDHYAKKVYW